jgi:sugar phosphate isomerase/epimerase
MTSSPWPLAAVLPAEPADFIVAVRHAAAQGFTHVELTALADRPAEHLDALADAGAVVACASLTGDPSTGSVQQRRETLRLLQRQIADAARLGATCAVIDSGAGHEAYFSEGCTILSAYAAGRMMKLAVRPIAGTCVADVPAALAWLERAGDANLGLAGTIEGAPGEAERIGGRLFHVYLRGAIIPAEWVGALHRIGYRGVVATVVAASL